jgi:hypothetical protein
MIHMASVWVPFTSESKEAIADYDEIRKEMKLALMECGRKLGTYLRKRAKMKREGERRDVFQKYIGEIAKAINAINGADAKKLYDAAVLLTGGGTAFDEHWTTPGSMESEGHAIQLTIDGKDTRDADLLAAALAERGLIVMQWSLVHSGDALRDGMLGDPLTYVQGMPVARAALAALRARPEVNPNRIILLGHSLGATRSFQICDDGVIGVASLAGAYLDRSLVAPRKTAEDVWASFAGADTDGDNALSASEFAAAGAPAARLGVTFDGGRSRPRWHSTPMGTCRERLDSPHRRRRRPARRTRRVPPRLALAR